LVAAHAPSLKTGITIRLFVPALGAAAAQRVAPTPTPALSVPMIPFRAPRRVFLASNSTHGVINMSSTPATRFPFISQAPKIGDPPKSDWAAFEQPRLRRFPDPDGLKLRRFLGRGTQGFVFKAKIGEGRELTVKFVRLPGRPPVCPPARLPA
jgi:hypothetical protein